jgi:hypothetical protein
MITTKVTTIDRTEQLKRGLHDIARMRVYVGIPEENASRPGDNTINNAELLFIQTNGSPINKIPPRPVIEPAIEAEDNKEAITGELRQSAKAIFEGSKQQAIMHMRTAGQEGVNAARNWFDDPRNGWPPNTEGTARRKIMKMQGTERDAALEKLDWGEDVSDLVKPLIDTGEMRKSITFVMGEE